MPVLLEEPIVDDATRREFLVGGAALAALLAGCGAPAAPPPAATPRAVAHRYGETTVPASPRRVVCVGFSDHDHLLALGSAPVGFSPYEYTADPDRTWPWSQERLGTTQPVRLAPTELDLEAIAALAPDLITGFTSGITEQEFAQLSRIAPTVAQPVGERDFFAPWEVVTRLAGQVLGAAERAEELVAGVQDRFAAARAQNPAFDGAVAVYAAPLEAGGFYAETVQSSRVGILTALGFRVPDEFTDLAGDRSYAEISPERLDLLDRDVLVWEISTPGARAAIEATPLYPGLAVVREGRVVHVEEPVLAGAMAFVSVLSLPYVIDNLVPMLAAAVDGDPTTEVTQ